jgi:hypothetical protein
MNKLKIFLKENKISYAKFGLLINKSKSQVGFYARNLCIPPRETMKKIVKVTKSFVKPNDFYVFNSQPDTPQQPPASNE